MASPAFNEVDPSTLSERFDAFHIVTVPYKTITEPEHHQITTSILIPKTLLEPAPGGTAAAGSGPARPLFIRFHGGGFVTGSALYEQFYALIYTDVVERERAITVCPNYRLLPESPIEHALADIADHWDWVRDGRLGDVVARETAGRVSVDVGRIMLGGESAGGFFALMQALSQPGGVRSVVTAYPMFDMRDRHFIEHYKKDMWGQPQFPASVYDDHVAAVRDGRLPGVVSADPNSQRQDLIFAMIQQGRFRPFFPPDKHELLVLDRVAAGERFPRGGVFVWHGRDDHIVPLEGIVKLQRLVKQLDPAARFELLVEDGDHGYDVGLRLHEWEPRGFKDAIAEWLK